jgi:hypothetical protein
MDTQPAKTELQILEEKIIADRKLRTKLKRKEKVDKFKSIPLPVDEKTVIMNVLNKKKEVSASFIISVEDFERVSKINWHITNQGYIINGKIGLLHRWLLGLVKGDNTKIADHINNNPLDNRKSNLRITDYIGNNRNKSKQSHINGNPTSSQYKGVSKTRNNKWKAEIFVDGKHIHLGMYDSEIDAAKVYDEAAVEYFGEFSQTNGISNEIVPVRNEEKKPSIYGTGIYNVGALFRALISIKGQTKYIGTFSSPELAQEARTKFIEDNKNNIL